jgi:hypothetical protein
MVDYLMQARSSADQALYSWVRTFPDFNASGFPGPGTPQDVAVAKRLVKLTASIDGSFRVREQGAVGDGVVNDTTAWSTTIALAGAAGGVVSAGVGTYLLNNLLITASGVRLVGDGPSATKLRPAQAGSFIKFQNCSDGGIERLLLERTGTSQGGYALELNGCTLPAVEDVRIRYFAGGTFVDNCDGVRIGRRYFVERITAGGGTGALRLIRSTNVRVDSLRFNQPYNSTGPLTIKSWATSTAFAVGDVVFTNDGIWECVVAGTSAAAGTGPSFSTAFPGVPAPNVFATQVVDGSARWLFIVGNCFAIDVDSGVSKLSVGTARIHGSSQGFIMRHDFGGGASAPAEVHIQEFVSSRTNGCGLALQAGSKFVADYVAIDSEIGNNGVDIRNTFVGDAQFHGGIVRDSWHRGVNVSSGPIEVHLRNLEVLENSQHVAGAEAGIVFVTNSHFTVQGCVSRGVRQSHGMVILGATSDNFIVQGNKFAPNVTGSLLNNAGTSATKVVANNI